jgi:hypothetical protein
MKRMMICLVFVLLFISAANAQTKSMTGTVVDRQVGNSGKWAGIVIEVGNRKYFVYTESVDLPTPKTVGRIDEVGRTVQVFYAKIENSPGYDGELRATKIVEVKNMQLQQPRPIQGSPSSINPKLIGYVRKEHLIDGCGCTYHLKNERNWTSSSNVYSGDYNGDIWMNIDGEDVRLKRVNSVSVPKGEARRGQRTVSNYIAPGIKVRITTVIGGNYGEGNDYSGTITVIKGIREQTVQIVGSCGC